MGNRWGNSGNSVRLFFFGSKITADGDCNHEIKRRLLLGRKVMTNLEGILKSRDITLPTKFCLVSSVQFSHSVVSDSLRLHESQHTRPPCPSPTPRVHSDSTSIESVMPSSHLILCCPLLLLPPISSSIRVFSNESWEGSLKKKRFPNTRKHSHC